MYMATKQMSPQIEKIWLSNYQRVLSLRLKEKYKLSSDQKTVIEQSIDAIYNGEAHCADLPTLLKTKNVGSSTDLKNIVRDIIGYCILPAKDYFKEQGEDIEKILQDSGGIAKEYLDNVLTFKKALAEEEAGTYDHDSYLYPPEVHKDSSQAESENNEFLSVEEVSNLSPEELKLGLLNFFDEGLNDLLSLENGDMLETVNEELIQVLNNNEKYKKEIETYLLGTKITIGITNLNLADKEVPPISANWLKDFFSVAGADSFDTLSIAKYIISSPNAKNLSEDEQAKLRRFLTLYHNIHFFPAPFTALPVEKWEVIPGAHANTQPTKIDNEILDKPIPKRQPKWSVTPKTETPVAPVTRSKSQELIDLEKMRDQYAIGTLERAAIEEEIKHFEQS